DTEETPADAETAQSGDALNEEIAEALAAMMDEGDAGVELDAVSAATLSAPDEAPVIAGEPFEETIDTPQQILKVAQQAVSEGRAANAKLLLLQAAASIAEAEAAESQRASENAARRIQEEAEAIEAAMKAVSDTEGQ